MLVLAALSSACGGARGNAGLPVATVDASGDTGTRDVALAVDGGVADTSLGEDRFEAVDSTVTDLGFDVAVTDVGVSEACVATGGEDTNAQCTDRVDNDCDGHTDCDDYNCQHGALVTVCSVDAGMIDTGMIDTGMIDTGMIDAGMIDTGTRDSCVVTGSENTNARCGDRVDNDCDGYIDCNDFDCSRGPSVTVCGRDSGVPCTVTGSEDTNAQCGDRVDNDCDGHIDCDDFNCSMSATVTLCRDASVADVPRVDTGCVRSGIETSLAECADHIDNDCDGYTDCADRNCSCVGACGAYLPGCACRGSENTNAACVDRVDNDCNGFVDCSDFGCSRSASVSVCADAGSH